MTVSVSVEEEKRSARLPISKPLVLAPPAPSPRDLDPPDHTRVCRKSAAVPIDVAVSDDRRRKIRDRFGRTETTVPTARQYRDMID
jgi:hypothetical protein